MATPYNPLAYQRPKALRKQARRDVRSVTMPLIRQTNREAASGARNIAGIASELARQMGGYQGRLADIYSRAGASLGALDQSQRASLGTIGSPGPLTGGGNTLADQLRSQLALSGQGGGQADQLQAMTQGAAGAGYARGSAELGALAQRQAAAEEWAAKLPELTRLSGAQAVQERAARAQQDISRVNASIPEQVQRLIEAGRSRNMQSALANLAYQGDVMAEQGRNAREAAAERGRNRRARATAAETARHNRNMEAADQASENRQEKIRRETARHNRAMEKISKGKGLSKKPGKTSLLP